MIYSKWFTGPMPAEAEAIRRAVFVEELGDSPEDQFDGQDQRAWHLVVEDDGKMAATGRITLDGKGNWVVGKVAVLPAFRRQYIGDFTVRLMVDKIRSMPSAPIYATVPEEAVRLFTRIGFIPQGEAEAATGRLHQRMVFPEDAQLTGTCQKS